MTAAVVLRPQTGSPFSQISCGVGDDARLLEGLLNEAARRLQNSLAVGGKKESLFHQLYEVSEECGSANWDGYGAMPISFEAFEKAKQFILSIPYGIPVPEVSAEPDGEITFEWFSSPSRVFSVSVGPNNELTYAGLFGASRTYGTEVFYDEIPEVVLSHVKRVVR
jgi:hypothetical protein